MKIIVMNCGSSSIKYQLFDMKKLTVLAKGTVEKIGLHGSFLENKREDGDEVKLEGEIYDHQQGIEYILGVLVSKKHGSLESFDEIGAVGHRVVHGGEKFKGSVLITKDVLDQIREVIDLAPLHNPPNLKGIEAMQEMLPKVPQVAVFDTAFHQTIPRYAYTYAIPYTLYKKYGIRRYGFHGTSHRFVSQQACEYLGCTFENKRVITCHLGNGASMAAIKDGKSIDTSMGLTPVEGLIMGTRTGDLDLGVLTYVVQKEELTLNAANTLINKFSGMLGISGVSSDMRDIEQAAKEGNERATLALETYAYRIKKYIGAYSAVLGGLDVLVFAGGIGENDVSVRANSCEDMEYLGIEIDAERNRQTTGGKRGIISSDSSRVDVVVMPTNEELVIARDTMEIVKGIK
jgi:acetate kinase